MLLARTEDERREILQCTLQERTKRGRSWRKGIDKQIREKGLVEDLWMDKDYIFLFYPHDNCTCRQ